MANRSRVPEKDSEFDTYIRNTNQALKDGTVPGAQRLGLSPAEAGQWDAYTGQWVAIYAQYTNLSVRTRAITTTKNTVKNDFTAFARPLLNKIAVSDALTEADREVFNLPARDATPTPRGSILEAPIGNLRGLGGALIEVRAQRATDATRASMHPLADGVEIKYMMMDNNNQNPNDPNNPNNPNNPNDKVPLPEDCPLGMVSKSALWHINVGMQNQGSRMIAYLRWVNLSDPANNSGWSDLITTYIS